MANQERGAYSREDIIVGSVPKRAARKPEIIVNQSLRSEEWRSAVLINPREPRVKVNGFGEILTMAYRMRRGDSEHVRIEVPRKYLDIDQAIRGNSHSKDGSSEAKDRISGVLDIVEESLENLQVKNPTGQMIVTAKVKARQRLMQEGFISPETGKTKVIKPRRKTAIEQSLLRELDIDTLIAGRALIARTVESAASANWLLELLVASFADFKAETVHNFLSSQRRDAISALSTMLNFAKDTEKNLHDKRQVLIPARIEAFKRAARSRLNHRFRPFLESEILIKLFLLGELDISTLTILFKQQGDQQKREENFQKLIEFARQLEPIDHLVNDLDNVENRTKLAERLRAVKGVSQGTISFSGWNIGHSRRGSSNPKSGSFETEKLPL